MTAESKGRDLFIVDNSVSGWTGLRYLEEWSGIAKAFDIATGYFEIGALLALDGKWQPLEKIRILMGAEMTHRTRKALLEAVRSRAVEILDGSIEAAKEGNPFPPGRPQWRVCSTAWWPFSRLARQRLANWGRPSDGNALAPEDVPGLELGPSDAVRMYLKRVDAPVGVKPAGWS